MSQRNLYSISILLVLSASPAWGGVPHDYRRNADPQSTDSQAAISQSMTQNNRARLEALEKDVVFLKSNVDQALKHLLQLERGMEPR